jgi:hypothetical protein
VVPLGIKARQGTQASLEAARPRVRRHPGPGGDTLQGNAHERVVPGPGRRLRQLGHGEGLVPDGVALEHPAGGLPGRVVAAESVAQHGDRVVGERDDPLLAPRRRGLRRRGDQLGRRRLPAAQGGEQDRAVPDGRAARHVREQAVLLDHRLGRGQLAGQQFVVGEEVQRELQLDERAGVAREPDLTRRQRPPGREVEHLGGDGAARPVAQ